MQAAVAAKTRHTAHSRPEHFTQRERQVLSFVFEGLANKEIAERIDVSESSVKATLQQLFAKTGAHNRAQLVRIALEHHKNELLFKTWVGSKNRASLAVREWFASLVFTDVRGFACWEQTGNKRRKGTEDPRGGPP